GAHLAPGLHGMVGRVPPLVFQFSFFFFQAEDGIRYPLVTGVQTCALPICDTNLEALEPGRRLRPLERFEVRIAGGDHVAAPVAEIGRASCRERVWMPAGAVAVETKVEVAAEWSRAVAGSATTECAMK